MIILSKLFRDIYPTDSGIIFVWWETCELFSQEITQTGQIPTGNSEPVHNFPEKLILTFFFPNISNCDRSYCTSVVLTGCQSLVALVEAISTAGGTRSDSYRVEMPNRTGNFRNFQISKKKKRITRSWPKFTGKFLETSWTFYLILNQNFQTFWSNGTRP